LALHLAHLLLLATTPTFRAEALVPFEVKGEVRVLALMALRVGVGIIEMAPTADAKIHSSAAAVH